VGVLGAGVKLICLCGEGSLHPILGHLERPVESPGLLREAHHLGDPPFGDPTEADGIPYVVLHCSLLGVDSLTSVLNCKTSNGFTFIALLTEGGTTHFELTNA
jgi:hypothetical protein